jgi:ABC-type antimicrobial peptide transport system permease subunit
MRARSGLRHGSKASGRTCYGLSPIDPVAYLGTAAVLTLAAIAATIIPARRAMTVDPVVALRHE